MRQAGADGRLTGTREEVPDWRKASLWFCGPRRFRRRIKALGVGTRPLDKRRMTADDLITAFQRMDDPAVRAHAQALGAAIRSEDGIGTAVAFIEERLTRAKPGGFGGLRPVEAGRYPAEWASSAPSGRRSFDHA